MMTINVAIKCPDGIVMGADSLVSLVASDGGSISSIIPYYNKLFPIGISQNTLDNFAAGAMLNGAGSIGGRTIEDIISEFGEEYSKTNPVNNYSLQQLTTDLGNKVQKIIDTTIAGKNPLLEIIIGGYSKGERAAGKRYGEIYSLFWEQQPYKLRVLYTNDVEFGTHYGGQPQMLDRFRYGIDDWILANMLKKRKDLFNQTRDYIIDKLKENGVSIPSTVTIGMPTSMKQFDIFNLFSDYELGSTPGQTMKNIKEGMVEKVETMERFLSLQTAINYCTFLMSCSYAQNNFAYAIPTVGSEMRVASITRHDGFKYRKIWEIQTPGPPFR